MQSTWFTKFSEKAEVRTEILDRTAQAYILWHVDDDDGDDGDKWDHIMKVHDA